MTRTGTDTPLFLKIREDVFHLPTEDGVLFRDAEGAFVLRGRGLYPLVQRLVPILDGETDVRGALAGVGDAQRQIVDKVLSALLGQRLLRRLDRDAGDGLDDAQRRRYRSFLALAARRHDDPAGAFARYRRRPTLLVGDAAPLLALATAGLEHGLLHQSLLLVGESASWPERARLDEQLDFQRADDPELAYQWLGVAPRGDDVESWTRHVVTQERVIVLLTESEPARRLLDALTRLCQAHETPLLSALVAPDGAWIGPLRRDAADPCARCLSRRRGLQTSQHDAPQHDAPQHDAPPHDAPPHDATEPNDIPPLASTLAAGLLHFDLFKDDLGVRPPETRGAAMHIDRRDWQIRRRPLVADASCPVCGGGARFMSPIADDEASDNDAPESVTKDPDALLRAVQTHWIDSHIGPVGALDEGDLAQSPIRQCRAIVRRVSATGGIEEIELPATAATAADARREAARVAAAWHARDILGPRASIAVDVSPAAAHRRLQLHAIADAAVADDDWSPLPLDEARTPASDDPGATELASLIADADDCLVTRELAADHAIREGVSVVRLRADDEETPIVAVSDGSGPAALRAALRRWIQRRLLADRPTTTGIRRDGFQHPVVAIDRTIDRASEPTSATTTTRSCRHWRALEALDGAAWIAHADRAHAPDQESYEVPLPVVGERHTSGLTEPTTT